MSNYLNRQQRKFEDYAESYRKEANEVFRELTRQLILVDTVFLSVLAVVFGNEKLIKKLNVCDKYILLSIFVLLTSSLIFGAIQFFIDSYYFKKWMYTKFSVVEGIVEGEITEDNLSDKVKEEQANISNESSTTFVWAQVISLFIAMILLVMFVARFIFSI